jgi:hypothetical protein
MRRWSKHIEDFAIGGRTVWNPKGDSVRNLMSRPVGEHEDLCKKGLLWIPGRKNGSVFDPHYSGCEKYHPDWWDWVKEFYLWDLEVFACPLEDPLEALIFESQLQRYLIAKNEVKYYMNQGGQSWLGKPSVTDIEKLKSVQFRFEPLPRKDQDGTWLLESFGLCLKSA